VCELYCYQTIVKVLLVCEYLRCWFCFIVSCLCSVQHLSCVYYMDVETEDYRSLFMLYCVPQLCTFSQAVLTSDVIWVCFLCFYFTLGQCVWVNLSSPGCVVVRTNAVDCLETSLINGPSCVEWAVKLYSVIIHLAFISVFLLLP